MKRVVISCLLLMTCYFLSCSEEENNSSSVSDNDSLTKSSLVNQGEVNIIEPQQDEEVVVIENEGITLTEIKVDNNKKASIQLNTHTFKEGVNQLNFNVSGIDNYQVSYLANNYYLTQFSSDVFEMEFLTGNNVFLAFLTDKKGIGVKTNQGCVLKNALVGVDESMFDMDQPHLFYYMPQEHTNEAILDFYLVNTTLAENGNKVKVTINQIEFIIDKWAAYQIVGLPSPQNTIRIQLIDKNGNLIDGPFNDSGERNFNFINSAA